MADYFLPFLSGVIVSIVGFAVPSMLSMTAVKASIDKGKSYGLRFITGVSFVLSIQSTIALAAARYFLLYPEIIPLLKKIAVFVFIGLSINFFIQSRNKLKKATSVEEGNYYLKGMSFASLNMLAIPYYFSVSSLINGLDWVTLNDSWAPYIMGTITGAWLTFGAYVSLSTLIIKKYQKLAENINKVLSFFFILLALVVAIQVF